MADMNDDSLSGRLARLLELRKLTQGELAKAMGVTQAAVSNWVSGAKEPTASNVEALARTLGATPEWLRYGQGAGPMPDVAAEREAYRRTLGWRFRRAPQDGGRDYGNAGVWAFDPEIWVMVRDIVQNCRDAASSAAGQVEVTFRIVRLRGKHLDEFKEAMKWDELLPHLRASAAIDQRLGRLINQNLRRLDQEKELILLVVEDRGTIGLLGDEDGEGNFPALVRNSLDSNKQSVSAGGAFGLGKAVLWRMSAFSLVLFSSNLSKPTSGGNSRCRVMARCDLPWHNRDNRDAFAGPGWFGRVDGERTVSHWDNATLAADLYLGGNDQPGTTVAVVGFYDPSCEEDRTLPEIAREIKRSVADCFWPDLTARRLKVNVEIYEGPERKSGSEVAADEYREEYVDALSKWLRDDELEVKLQKPGDVVCTLVPLNYPERRAQPTHPKGTHEAVLLVRYAEGGPGEDGDKEKRLNHLAVFRGVGMVVQYFDLQGICLGAVPFHAALLCGEARARPGQEPSPDSRMAERFLRTSEPPNHDRWTSTADLASEYHRPGKKAIDNMIAAARVKIRDLVRPSTKDLSDGPNSLKELLQISEDEPPASNRPHIHRPIGTVHDDGSWSVVARIRLRPVDKEWLVRPVILFEQETGAGQPVKWKNLTAVKNCRVTEDNELILEEDAREAIFEGISDPDSHPIDARESSITVDLRKCKLIEAEGGEA